MTEQERVEAAIRDAMIVKSPELRKACGEIQDRYIGTQAWSRIPGFYDEPFATAYAHILAPFVAERLSKEEAPQ